MTQEKLRRWWKKSSSDPYQLNFSIHGQKAPTVTMIQGKVFSISFCPRKETLGLSVLQMYSNSAT